MILYIISMILEGGYDYIIVHASVAMLKFEQTNLFEFFRQDATVSNLFVYFVRI